jgi:hypothetical protein
MNKVKVPKPYNRLLRKRRFSWLDRKTTRLTVRAVFNPECFWHRWGLVNYGYSKRKMEAKRG